MKDQLSSPFRSPHGTTVPQHTTEPGAVIDHNACPVFASPARAARHGGVEEVFFAGVVGKNYHGDAEKNAATISTTMGGKKK
jgi:hypothetical protein